MVIPMSIYANRHTFLDDPIKNVVDNYVARHGDGDLYSDDLGFGKERKIGTQATEFLSKRKNWTVGNICSKQELIDKIKEDRDTIGESHLFLKGNIIGVVIDHKSEPKQIYEALKMQNKYYETFGVELPFYSYNSTIGKFHTVSKQYLNTRITETIATEELGKILKYGSLDTYNFSNIIISGTKRDIRKTRRLLNKIGVEVEGKQKKRKVTDDDSLLADIRPSIILGMFDQAAYKDASQLCNSVFNILFECDNKISIKDGMVNISFPQMDPKAQKRLYQLDRVMMFDIEHQKFLTNISDKTISIDLSYLILNKDHILESLERRCKNVLDINRNKLVSNGRAQHHHKTKER